MKTLNIPRLVLFTIVLLANVVSCAPLPAAAVATTEPSAAPKPADVERTLRVGDVERSYLLHIPPGMDSSQPVPVVFAFHGSDSDPASLSVLTGLDDIADEAGFLVVYPAGIGSSWDAGQCCAPASDMKVDEPAFIRQILSDLGTTASVDPKRVYAAGFSNGAALTFRLACEMSDTLAAVAPVAGALLYSPCKPSQPISLIQVNGLLDDQVPYQGGGDFNIAPVADTIAVWAEWNGCTGSPKVEKEEIVTHTIYAACNANTAVELHTLKRGGHSWPQSYVWPASKVIWKFFAAHPKP